MRSCIRLHSDCTANYGHSPFLWNICAGGLLFFFRDQKGFCRYLCVKKGTNCGAFKLRNLCFYWVDDICILCMMNSLHMNLLFSKPPLRCSIIPEVLLCKQLIVWQHPKLSSPPGNATAAFRALLNWQCFPWYESV